MTALRYSNLLYGAAAFALVMTTLTLSGCGPNGAFGPVIYGDCSDVLGGTPRYDVEAVPTAEDYAAALATLDIDKVKADMAVLLLEDNACWPADDGNYGPFMIRLAWHCSGTYRATDGVGGCGGGRMRFEPERSWPDNTNLDKARALLYPLKVKYGDALSWGDLYILAGTVAYEQAGTPIAKMCFGRIDQPDGSESEILNEPCAGGQGHCEEPHGPTTVGLIYVNPGGVRNVDGSINPDPALSAAEIRRTFTTMGHSDQSTVALIGGGHTVGRTHGACPDGAGNSPDVAFAQGTQIWKGNCGDGKGPNTFTSGFEGVWTEDPNSWDNSFFTELNDNVWSLETGPGGNFQWSTPGKSIVRLTSDLALKEDAQYKHFVDLFASDMGAFNSAFDLAWFDLTTTHVGGEWSSAATCTDGSLPPTRQMRTDEGPSMVV